MHCLTEVFSEKWTNVNYLWKCFVYFSTFDNENKGAELTFREKETIFFSYISRAKIIQERLDGDQMNICFEIAALFHSAIW